MIPPLCHKTRPAKPGLGRARDRFRRVLRGSDRTPHAVRGGRAAPAGGARSAWGRGCGSLAAALLTAGSAIAQVAVPVPSGQTVTLSEILIDTNPGEPWLRFRFVAPQIAPDGGIDHAEAAADMDHLCQELAVPYVAKHDLTPSRVVISMADRPLDFGKADPAATQFFETYRLEDARCIWEEF